jgi:hypothetical protein
VAAKKPLRVVTPSDTPPRKKMTVTAAAATGTRRDLLIAMRERVATAVEAQETPARDLAALTRRLMEISREIEALNASDDEGGGDVGDGDFDATAI